MSESKIIVAFCLPKPSANDIENALNASQEIIFEQDVLIHQLCVYPEIELGLSIASGPAITVVANTNERAMFNIYSDILNILDKSLKYTSKFIFNILVTENVNEIAKTMYHTRRIYSITDKDKTHNLFSIESSLKEELSQDILTSTICYELGLSDFYAKNWFGALNHFKKSFILINDGPSKAMMKRCENILENSKLSETSQNSQTSISHNLQNNENTIKSIQRTIRSYWL